MTSYNVQKYVNVEVYVDGKYVDHLLVTRTLSKTLADGVSNIPKAFTMRFGGKKLDCRFNQHEQGIKTRLDFTTVKGATIEALFAEIASRVVASTERVAKLEAAAKVAK